MAAIVSAAARRVGKRTSRVVAKIVLSIRTARIERRLKEISIQYVVNLMVSHKITFFCNQNIVQSQPYC